MYPPRRIAAPGRTRSAQDQNCRGARRAACQASVAAAPSASRSRRCGNGWCSSCGRPARRRRCARDDLRSGRCRTRNTPTARRCGDTESSCTASRWWASTGVEGGRRRSGRSLGAWRLGVGWGRPIMSCKAGAGKSRRFATGMRVSGGDGPGSTQSLGTARVLIQRSALRRHPVRGVGDCALRVELNGPRFHASQNRVLPPEAFSTVSFARPHRVSSEWCVLGLADARCAEAVEDLILVLTKGCGLERSLVFRHCVGRRCNGDDRNGPYENGCNSKRCAALSAPMTHCGLM